jgi:hypothetical protein
MENIDSLHVNCKMLFFTVIFGTPGGYFKQENEALLYSHHTQNRAVESGGS